MIEKLIWKITWMLPRKIVYLATVRLMVHATTGKYSDTIVPELEAMEAIGRWSKDHWGWT